MNKIVLIFLFIFTSTLLSQETGTIAGIITDKEFNNEPLPFATIAIKGTNDGTTSDLDGLFSFENLPVGNYNLIISFVGYESIELNDIEVVSNRITNLNVPLSASSATLDEVVIRTTTRRASEVALMLDRKNAIELKQSIGAEEMSRKGLSDASAAIANTVGVSRQGGQNIFVRGLGDRYNSTTINNLPVVSNDPEKKNMDLSIFSSDIIEFVGIEKVYNASIFGDFAGGNININTKNYSGPGFFNAEVSNGFNTNAVSKNPFFLQDGPDKLGLNITQQPETLAAFTFENSLNLNTVKNPIDLGFSLSGGKSFTIGDQGRLNLFATVFHKNSYDYKDEGFLTDADADGVFRRNQFTFDTYGYTTNSSGMLNLVYSINPNNRVSYNFLAINTSNQTVDEFRGTIVDIADFDNGFLRRTTFIKNTLFVNQLLGNHNLGERYKLSWGLSHNTVKGDMPDRVQNTFRGINDTEFVFGQNQISDNHRYFQSLVETEYSGNVSISYLLGVNEDLENRGMLTLGYSGKFKERDFEANQFNFRILPAGQNETVDPYNLDAFLNQQNFQNGLFDIATFRGNQFVPNALDPQIYGGEQIIHGVYANLEYKLSDKLTGLLGIRGEYINQEVSWKTQLDDNGGDDAFDETNILPSLIFRYAINEKQNLRFGASKTYTLPQFKERALFIYEDVADVKLGNPDLYPSTDYNVDIKWELFPNDEEIISATLFGKYIEDAMNEVTIASSSNDISVLNTGDFGYVGGIEVEGRKVVFDNKSENSQKIIAGFNAAYMVTYQELDSEKIRRETRYNVEFTNDEDSFSGASDLLINGDLTFLSSWKENHTISLTGSYSYFSDRIYSLGTNGRGNIFEKPYSSLNFILNAKINRVQIGMKASNLLNPDIIRAQDSRAGVVDILSYKRGIGLGLSIGYNF